MTDIQKLLAIAVGKKALTFDKTMRYFEPTEERTSQLFTALKQIVTILSN